MCVLLPMHIWIYYFGSHLYSCIGLFLLLFCLIYLCCMHSPFFSFLQWLIYTQLFLHVIAQIIIYLFLGIQLRDLGPLETSLHMRGEESVNTEENSDT